MSFLTKKRSIFKEVGKLLGSPKSIATTEINFLTTIPTDPFEQSDQFIWRLGDTSGFHFGSIIPVRLCANNLNVVLCMSPLRLKKSLEMLSHEDGFKTVRATEDNQVGTKQIGVVNTAKIRATSEKNGANISFNVSRLVKDGLVSHSNPQCDNEGTRLFVSSVDLPTYESLRPKNTDPYAVPDNFGLGRR